VNLSEMRAERVRLHQQQERLNAEIRAVEEKYSKSWNLALDACEDALGTWLSERKIEVESRDRKNALIWDVGHGALTVIFVRDDERYGRGALQMVSGRTLTLEWSEVPEPARMIAIVTALLGRT
jgi:hypothetical protein